MRQTLAVVTVVLVLTWSISGCARLRPHDATVTSSPTVSIPASDLGLDTAIADLDTVGDAVDQVERDASSGEQAENTTDAP